MLANSEIDSAESFYDCGRLESFFEIDSEQTEIQEFQEGPQAKEQNNENQDIKEISHKGKYSNSEFSDLIQSGIVKNVKGVFILDLEELGRYVYEPIIEVEWFRGRDGEGGWDWKTRERTVGYRLVSKNGTSASLDLIADAHNAKKGEKNVLDVADGVLTFALHALPGGTAADYLVNGNGTKEGVIIATIADGASVLTLGGSKVYLEGFKIGSKTVGKESGKWLIISGTAANSGLVVYDGKQMIDSIRKGDARGAAGQAGNLVFRIVTTKAGVKTVSKIFKAPKANLRQLYTDEVAGLEKVGKDLLAAGKSEAEVAKTLQQMRRDLGVKYKDMTPPDLLDYIYKFNEARYGGDKLGPTYEWLKKAQLKTDAQIIAGASKPLGDMKQLGAALHKHFGDEIAPILRKYGMLD